MEDAREWYADYIRERGTVPTWPTLINEFSRYYSTQGRGIKNLHDSWRKMTFEPETDDIEIFIRDAQECAKQLNYDDSVLMNMLKAAHAKSGVWNIIPHGNSRRCHQVCEGLLLQKPL